MMKKSLLLFALLSFVGLQLQAQKCSGAKAAADKTACTKSAAAAEKAASLDDTIEKRVDEKTGQATFVKRVVDAEGKTSYEKVKFCTEAGKFISTDKTKSSCSAGKATKVSNDGKAKACCVKGAKTKACCAKAVKNAEKAEVESIQDVKVKKVSNSGTN